MNFGVAIDGIEKSSEFLVKRVSGKPFWENSGSIGTSTGGSILKVT